MGARLHVFGRELEATKTSGCGHESETCHGQVRRDGSHVRSNERDPPWVSVSGCHKQTKHDRLPNLPRVAHQRELAGPIPA